MSSKGARNPVDGSSSFPKKRTYHAHLWSGKELSVPDLTLAMKQLNDFDVPLALQSSKSTLAEELPLKKSTNFYVPLSTWREISQEEAQATYQQGIPVLLYGEHAWEHPKGASLTWSTRSAHWSLPTSRECATERFCP